MSYDRWAGWVERRYRALLTVSLLIALLAALSLRAIRFDFDVLEMLPTGTPAFDNFKRFVTDFGELDELVILLEGDDPDGIRAFADRFGEHLGGLAETERVQVNENPRAIVDGVLGRFAVNYLPDSAFERLDRLARSGPAAFDAVMEQNRALLQTPLDLTTAHLVQRDPLGLLRLTVDAIETALGPTAMDLADAYVSSADGRAVLIFVRPKQNAFDISFTTRLMEGVHRSEASTREELGATSIRVGYTGSYVFALEDAATIRWDVRSYVLLALLAVLAVFLLGYRNLRILPFVTYPLLITALVTFALSLVLFDRLNAVSTSFAAILYGLSIDSGIHYYTRLLQEVRDGDLRTAVARTLRALAGANIVASMTTASVFTIIGFSALAGVRQLGILTALGMVVNVVQFFVVYPALTFLMPGIGVRRRSLETPRLGRVAAVCAAFRRPIAAFAGACLALSLYGASQVRVEANLLGLRPAVSEAQKVERRIESLFGAPVGGGAVLVTGPTSEPVLRLTERVAARLRVYAEEGEVALVRSITALLPSEATQHARLRRFAALPRRHMADELRLAMKRSGFVSERFDAFFDSFAHPGAELVSLQSSALDPFRLVLERYVRVQPGGFTVATYIEPGGGTSMARVEERLRHDLPGADFVLAGRPLLERELGRVLREEFATFLILAFASNVVLVWFNFRRPLLTAAIVAPQILVLTCCLSAMYVWGIPIGPVNIVIFPLILGIGIDDCVYLAERYVEGEDIATSVCSGGRALVITSLTTMAGFGFLGLSRYPALSGMGILSALGLLLCLLLTLTLLPALLALGAPRRRAGAR